MIFRHLLPSLTLPVGNTHVCSFRSNRHKDRDSIVSLLLDPSASITLLSNPPRGKYLASFCVSCIECNSEWKYVRRYVLMPRLPRAPEVAIYTILLEARPDPSSPRSGDSGEIARHGIKNQNISSEYCLQTRRLSLPVRPRVPSHQGVCDQGRCECVYEQMRRITASVCRACLTSRCVQNRESGYLKSPRSSSA